MKIKYLSCDGETEVIEEVMEIEFYEYNNFVTNLVTQGMECVRSPGDTFVIDCNKVFYITK